MSSWTDVLRGKKTLSSSTTSQAERAKKNLEEAKALIEAKNEEIKNNNSKIVSNVINNANQKIKSLVYGTNYLAEQAKQKKLEQEEQEKYNNMSTLEKIGYNYNKYIGYPTTSFLFGYGEGSGGGATSKGLQDIIMRIVSIYEAKRAADEKARVYGTTADYSNLRNESQKNYRNLKTDLPTSEENLEEMYRKLGDHQTARTLGNITGYINTGTALTSMGVPSPVAYGTLSGANAYGKTDDIGDIAFETAAGAVYGQISSSIGNIVNNQLLKIPVMNTKVIASNPRKCCKSFANYRKCRA